MTSPEPGQPDLHTDTKFEERPVFCFVRLQLQEKTDIPFFIPLNSTKSNL